MPPPFLRFEQLLLPPPLAAVSGLLVAIGIAGLGIAGARLAGAGLFFLVRNAPVLAREAAGLRARWRGWPLLDRALLVGLGEMLDLLGLAGGTDCLGAVLQYEGAVLAALAAAALATRDRDRLLAVALVLASPVLLFREVTRKELGLVVARTLWPFGGEHSWTMEEDFELRAIRLVP